jgi:hypothetical protein
VDDSPVHGREIKPIWTSASFLVYTGGLTVLGGGVGALFYLSMHYPGAGQGTAWTLLVLVILYAIAHGLRLRDRPIAAGIFAFASVLAWAIFVAVLFSWWGWNGLRGSFQHWSWSREALWLLILAAAWDDRRRFRFPFIAAISTIVAWIFVIDSITDGGSGTAVVTLLVGLAYLAWGTIRRTPSAFWLHVVGGLLIGGAILYWAHTSDGDFALVSIVALVFVLLAYATRRSSWAVLGALGFFIATVHYVVGSPTAIAERAFGGEGSGISGWSPALAFGLLGFWLVLLGLLGGRPRRPAPEEPALE